MWQSCFNSFPVIHIICAASGASRRGIAAASSLVAVCCLASLARGAETVARPAGAPAIAGVKPPGPAPARPAKSPAEIAANIVPALERDGSPRNPADMPVIEAIRREYAVPAPKARIAAIEAVFADKNRSRVVNWWSSLHGLAAAESDRGAALWAFTKLCETGGKSSFSAVRIVREMSKTGDGLPGFDPTLRLEQLRIGYRHIQIKMGLVFEALKLALEMPYPNEDSTLGTVMDHPRGRRPGQPQPWRGHLLISHAQLKECMVDTLELINTWMGTEFRLHPGVQRQVFEFTVTARGRIIAEDQQNAYGPSRFKALTAKFNKTSDQATVTLATCLGGPGTEWLSGVAVQPDDTICLTGAGLGPVLEISGRSPTVIGADVNKPPAKVDWTPSLDGAGKPVVDKIGRPIYDPLTWTDPRATGFVLRMSPDLKEIRSFHRLPWATGAITGVASDASGNLFIAGRWTEALGAALAGVCRDIVELPAGDQGGGPGATDRTFLARLSPDGGAVRWIRHMRGVSSSPKVSIDSKGQVVFTGPDLRVFGADGRIRNVIVVPGGLQGRIAYNPRDGTYARGGDHQSPTGHEPYRLVYINVYKPDGRKLLDLYHADGPFSGGATGVVSDSSVRAMAFDSRGDLVFAGWSDGGNTPLTRQPYDLLRGHGQRGTGMDSSGAMGATSVSHLVRLDGKTWKTKGYTVWMGYLATDNRLNGGKIDTIHATIEGSTLFSGESAWGMIQTGNSISGGEPGGSYIALINESMSSLRFSSAMPATGKVHLGDRQELWFLTSAIVRGRPIGFAVGSAVKEEEVYGKVRPPPMEHARQEGFGGGLTDGYVLMLDLGPREPDAAVTDADAELEALLGGGATSGDTKNDNKKKDKP
jgi:hypothetical protein